VRLEHLLSGADLLISGLLKSNLGIEILQGVIIEEFNNYLLFWTIKEIRRNNPKNSWVWLKPGEGTKSKVKTDKPKANNF
jgi:hypothetical protein